MRVGAILGGLLVLGLLPSVAGATPLTFGFTFTSDDHMFMTDGTITGDFASLPGGDNWKASEIRFNALPPEILAVHNPFPNPVSGAFIGIRGYNQWFVSDAGELVSGSFQWSEECILDCALVRFLVGPTDSTALFFNAHADIHGILEQATVRGELRFSQVPEPRSLTLLAAGLFGLLMFRRVAREVVPPGER